MIDRITLSNVKGITGSYELGELTIIHGRNSTGKSAVLDAITLALIGYHPKLGKKPNLTFQLATHDATAMSVATNDRVISWKKNAKGAVSIDGVEGLGDVPPVMLDINEWLGLTGPGKIQYILDHCGEVTGEAFADVDRLVEMNPRVAPQAKATPKEDTAVYLRKLGEFAKANQRQASTELETMQGSINQSLLSDAPSVKSPERELKMLDSQIKVLLDQLSTIKGSSDEVKRQRDAYAATLQRLGDPVARLSKTKAEITSHTGIIADVGLALSAVDGRLPQVSQELADLKQADSLNDFRAKQIQVTLSSVSEGGGSCPCCGAEVDSEKLKEDLESELEALADEMNSRSTQIQEVTIEISELNTRKSDLKSKLATSSGKLHGLKLDEVKLGQAIEQMDELKKKLDEPVTTADTTTLEAQVSELNVKRDPLLAQQKEFLAQRGVERQRAQAIQSRDAKAQELDIAKQLTAAIKAAEEELMAKVVGGLLENANKLIQPILLKSLTHSGGEFCLGKVLLSTLSGSEELVVFAGLQLALSIRVPGKVLILDELGRMDQQRFEAMMRQVSVLIKSGFISQFIGVLPGHALPKVVAEIEATILNMDGEL